MTPSIATTNWMVLDGPLISPGPTGGDYLARWIPRTHVLDLDNGLGVS